MSETFKRWYDEDPAVQRCVQTLESLDDSKKRQTATFLMDQIINKPPYSEMIPSEVFDLVTSESQRRRWYDFDEVVRLFIELLRHAPKDVRRIIAIMAITFIDDLLPKEEKSIEIED